MYSSLISKNSKIKEKLTEFQLVKIIIVFKTIKIHIFQIILLLWFYLELIYKELLKKFKKKKFE